MDAPTSSRRWLRINPPALLVTMAVAAVGLNWLAWQSSIVSERWALLSRIESEGGSYCSFGRQPILGPPEFSLDVRGGEIVPVPFVRRLLGDRAIHCITLPKDFAAQDRVEATFPDAELDHVGDFPHYH